MQKGACACQPWGNPKREVSTRCGQHPERLLPTSEGGTNPKAPACLVSGGESLWEKQFSAAVTIFEPEV